MFLSRKELILSFAIGFLFFINTSLTAAPKNLYPDSVTSSQSVSYADAFDSLYFLSLNQYYDNTIATSPYNYTSDYAPVFSEELIKQRLEEMNIASPFEFQYNAEVSKFIKFFSTNRRGMISRVLSKAEYYFPLFEEMLDKYDLPLELKYLSIVESSLNPNAVSHAGAAGLWQFMPATGRMYGLTYNAQIDERRDMYQATEAACRHFVDLYNLYHDWNLVLAAYNAGAGNVNKAIRRSDSAGGYWEVYNYLPHETRGYVPAFIAVNFVMHYHLEYNIMPSSGYASVSKEELDTICIAEKLSFSQIATITQLDESIIANLNPQYTKKYIPATENTPMTLTLPAEAIGSLIRYKFDILAVENEIQNPITQ